MVRRLENKWLFRLIILICLVLLIKQSDSYFKWIHPHKVDPYHYSTIHTDGAGYYMYLPQWYVYQSKASFSFMDSISRKYPDQNFHYSVKTDYKPGLKVDKYFVGTAICMSPVFLFTHGINCLLYGEGDGYSRSYQLAVSVNALLFLCLGVFAWVKFLRLLGVSKWLITWMTIAVVFGTNLNYYAIYFPAFSHVYSFAIISWFLLYAKKVAIHQEKKALLILAALLGLIILIRPTNALIILMLPFLFDSFQAFFNWLKKQITIEIKTFMMAGLIVVFLIFLQFLNVYQQTGDWKFSIYTDEHFDFIKNPQWYNVLFSYKKGAFVYAPILFLLFPAIVSFGLEKKYLFIGWLITSLAFLYITSSWWCWWYGGGLGMRPFIDIFPLLLLPFISLLQFKSKLIQLGIFLMIIPAIYIYQIYQVQFNKNIIHYDQMQKEDFWRAFNQTGVRFNWCAAYSDYHPNKEGKLIKSWSLFGSNKTIEVTDQATSVFTTSKQIDLTVKNDLIYFKVSGNYWISNKNSNPSISIYFYNKGKNIGHRSNFFGPRISTIQTMEKAMIVFTPIQKNTVIDSVVVYGGIGEVPTKFKDVKIQVYRIRE